ncbi:hypothetical protein G9A89_018150 [Geosiphon pyriformis]|nr:hypothetical protein G9A89_018150 [Geosiphon pyriformis]
MVFSGRFLLVLEAKQSSPIGSPVLENWSNQMKTESFFSFVFGAISGGAWKTISSCQKFAEWVASTLVPGATFKIKLAYIKTEFQSIHGFLDAKSVLKDNMKLFCVEFASQSSLNTAFLVELTSSVHLASLKIAKFLVVSEFTLSVFGKVSYVVLKSAGVWQYVVVYFKELDASILVGKDSVHILPLINQNETILFYNQFKAKLVNLLSGCTVFEISDMISQVGGQTCFISCLPDSGHCFQFALITFGSQVNLDSTVIKTKVSHLAVDCKVSLPSLFKTLKVFKTHFVNSVSYVKASAFLDSSEFSPLVAPTFLSVVISDFLVFSWLASLESDLIKLSVLVESIVKPVGFLVKLFKQFINRDLVSSSKLGLKINKVIVHISFFSKIVGKLEREVVSLKKECCMEDIDMFGNSEHSVGLDDEVFFNLMSFWEHEPINVKADILKTAE